MANSTVHLEQAQHNAAIANDLLARVDGHDWAVTTAFYAAIHYYEAWLYESQGTHTEANVGPNESPHSCRERNVGRTNWRVYEAWRALQTTSSEARYLTDGRVAWNAVKLAEADKLVNTDLAIIEFFRFSQRLLREVSNAVRAQLWIYLRGNYWDKGLGRREFYRDWHQNAPKLGNVTVKSTEQALLRMGEPLPPP